MTKDANKNVWGVKLDGDTWIIAKFHGRLTLQEAATEARLRAASPKWHGSKCETF